MTKRKETYRRLTHNSNDNTWLLTMPKEIVDANSWHKGQTLYLRNHDGLLYYKEAKDPLARKLKLQFFKSSGTWGIRVPYRTVEFHEWKPHQQFSLVSGKGIIMYNPFMYKGSKTLNGVAEPKKTGFNLPKKGGEVECTSQEL